MVSQINYYFTLNDIPMEDTLNIYSLNCRGLANRIKRASTFEWLRYLKVYSPILKVLFLSFHFTEIIIKPP